MLGDTPRRPAAARNGLKRRECLLTGLKTLRSPLPGVRHEQVTTIAGEHDGPLRLQVRRPRSRATCGERAPLDQRPVRIAAKASTRFPSGSLLWM